ncbi:DNA methylase [Pseudomonas putida]|uniref:DNA methylase n=1 Tax=Pseudomonas putida TaxID=303 RepID=UPI00349EEF6C
MNTVTARDLGIDVTSAEGLFRWLLASFLMGKRIRSSVAVQTYRVLVDQQAADTPGRLARCSHSTLVRLLGQGGYARYDQSTARRLHVIASILENKWGAQLEALQAGDLSNEGFSRWLLSFEGIGPKTLEIFMREGQGQLPVGSEV